MITLDREHPLAELISLSYVADYTICLMEQGDEVVPTYLQTPRAAYLKGRKQGSMKVAPKVFALSTTFKHEQFELLVMQDLARAFNRDDRMVFVTCVTHPDHEPLWAISEDGEIHGRSAVQIPHPLLGENMFRITYVDEVAESAFALSLITKVAVSVGPNKPDAFSESQLKTLTK
jgi:hypothetical protein